MRVCHRKSAVDIYRSLILDICGWIISLSLVSTIGICHDLATALHLACSALSLRAGSFLG